MFEENGYWYSMEGGDIWTDNAPYDNSVAARRRPPSKVNNACVHDVPLPWSTTGETVPIACGGASTHGQLLADQAGVTP